MKKILVSRTDGIGDLLLTTPLIKAVKESEGRPYVAVMAGQYASPVLENSPDLDEIIVYDGEKRKELLKTIKNGRFDACISVFPRFDTASLLAFAGIPRRIGTAYRWFSTLFFNEPVTMHRKYSEKHEADYNLELAEGIIGEKSAEKVYYYATPEERSKAVEYVRKKGLAGGFIIVHPGSRGSAWNLSVEKYSEIIEKAAGSIKVLISGGPSEKEKILGMRNSLKNGDKISAMDEPLGIRDFAAVIGESMAVVSGSTGPMHLAAALGVRTLSFFPPDSVRAMRANRWGPLGNTAEIIKPATGKTAPTKAMDTIPADYIMDRLKYLLAK